MGRPRIHASKGAANSEYCKRYRKKNKDTLKKTEKERKKQAREYEKYVHPEKLKKDRIRKREYRRRKAAESQTSTNADEVLSSLPCSSSSSSHQLLTSTPLQPSHDCNSSFSSKQSFHRSVSRAEKYLPNSPRKKTEVLNNLSNKYCLRVKLHTKRGPRPKYLSKEQEEWLMEILERPDMTYMNPGRKDNVYVGKVDGERRYLQKRYLLWSLRDTWEIINGQYECFKELFDGNLSCSKFYNFIKRKKEIIYQQDIPEASCLVRFARTLC